MFFNNLNSLQFSFSLYDIAQSANSILSEGLRNPNSITFLIVFLAGLLTSLGPCSISLLPITIAYIGGLRAEQNPIMKSFSFCLGVIFALVILGSLSGSLGRIYGQMPSIFNSFVAILAISMGLNLIGILRFPLPTGPDPNIWTNKVPNALAPTAAGIAFGLASTPCTTPVLATLLAWISQTKSPLTGMFLLTCFGFGQIIPLLLAALTTANITKLLQFRKISQWIPPVSGSVLVTIGLLSLISQWT
tara:strand:+ start:26902 stop:27642 length:741 start_codon:yes stop_codon:yes gene_type:complete